MFACQQQYLLFRLLEGLVLLGFVTAFPEDLYPLSVFIPLFFAALFKSDLLFIPLSLAALVAVDFLLLFNSERLLTPGFLLSNDLLGLLLK